MQKLSIRKTEHTALSELYYVNVSGTATDQSDNQILFFDKTLFTRKRAVSNSWRYFFSLKCNKAAHRWFVMFMLLIH